MKKIFFVGFLFISIFVFSINNAFAFGGWNSGGAQSMHVINYGYSAPAVYAPASAYVPVQNFGIGAMHGGFNSYMPVSYGNTWNQGFGGGFGMGINSGMGMGIHSGMSVGINNGGFMPGGYGPGYNPGYVSGYNPAYGYGNYGGGCSMYCYGSPIFY